MTASREQAGRYADCGALYVASGGRHTREAIASIRSLRAHMPELPVTLYSDIAEPEAQPGLTWCRLKKVTHSFRDKIAPLSETPYPRTLFLDSDTFVCAPVWDLFDLLEQFDLAVAHAPFRHDRPFETPNCFAECNTGVMPYVRKPECIAFFEAWLKAYDEECRQSGSLDSDQPAFRKALYGTSLRLYILTPEYNFRTVMPAFSGRGQVRILHGRARSMAKVAGQVNRSRSIRIFLPGLLHLHSRHFSILSASGRVAVACLDLLLGSAARCEEVLRPLKRRLLGR